MPPRHAPPLLALLTPPRRRGVEILDDPQTDPTLRERSLRDVARSNALLGGASAALAELDLAFASLSGAVTLIDVGTGLADIPERAGALARRRGLRLRTIGVDSAACLLRSARSRTDDAVCADARCLPFPDGAADVVICSQLLHHFAEPEALVLLREMDRVARHRVIVSDIRRSWLAAAGLWLVSFPLRFHPVSRHDGVVSVLRGFTPGELGALVRTALRNGLGVSPRVRRRFGFRLTASWRPSHAGGAS
jgi:SAM-dependent methyltransferase